MLIGIAAGLLVGVVLTFLVLEKSPVRDRGFRIFACTSNIAQATLIEILQEYGLKPRYAINSRRIKRALMNDNMTVLNWTESELWERMGRPAAGLAVVASDPLYAARRTTDILRHEGFQAEVLGELDEDVPAGSMVFVKTNALVGTVLVFRKHVTKMGPRPPKWNKS